MRNARSVAGLVAATLLLAPATVVPAGAEDSSSPNQSTEAGEATPESVALETLRTAHDLAAWAREARNPVALALAGSMRASVGVEVVEAPPVLTERHDGAASDASKADGSAGAASGEALIAEAREMAAGQRDVLRAVEAAADSVPRARGATRRPRRFTRIVPARSTHRHQISFHGRQFASIWVEGDGDTDLDCYVHDENGHLIDQDIDYTDTCLLQWTPAWTGMFTILVRNLGPVWNEYTLTTN